MKRLGLVFLALICCLLGGTAKAQGVQQGTLQGARQGESLDVLLARSAQAYGGIERLKAVAQLRMTGRIAAKGQAGQGRVERLFQAPDRLSSVIAYEGGARDRRVLIRDSAWRNGQPATVPEQHAMSLQLARLRLPLLLIENARALTDQGLREQGGRLIRNLSFTVAEGVSMTVAIDSQSGFVLQTVGRLGLADGTSADFTTLYGDYRLIDGLAFALREDHYSQGVQSGTTFFETIEVNRPAPANAFTP